MSKSLRHRAGLVLAGLVLGAPLLGAGVAHAATPTITFSGTPLLGLGTLACPSSPSKSTLTVSPGTTVDFVNRTGKPATLWAGDSQKTMPDKSLVPVTFTQGPAQVIMQMLPNCPLDLGSHTQMTVIVTAAAGQAPPVSTPTVRSTDPGATATPTAGQHSGSATPTKTPKPGHSGSPALAPTTDPGATPSSDRGAGSGTAGNNDPFASAPAVVAADPIVGEPVGPGTSHSASGLLTLIATVGVVGVSAAAIRAIIAQRATRLISA